MSNTSKAHKNFWIYVLIGAVLVFGMIYVSSVAQQKEDIQSQKLESELSEHKNQTKGIEASVQKITDENTNIKARLEEKNAEIEKLSAEADNLNKLTALFKAFIKGDYGRCKTIKSQIDTELLDAENLWLYDYISTEITKIKE